MVRDLRSEVGARFPGDLQGIENWSRPGDVLDELADLGIAPTFDCVPLREAVFFDAKGREYPLRSTEPALYLVRRGGEAGSLDAGLRAQAIAAGVEIRFGDVDRSWPESGIAAVGPRGADAVAAGYVFETDMADGLFALLSDRVAPKGYSYLVVSRGRGTVAACVFRDFRREKDHVDRTLEFFRKTVGLTMRSPRRFGGAGNYFYPETARRGGLLLAGEATGFQDALWGFGIRYALRSGSLAARALLEGAPEGYDRRWRDLFGGQLRASIVNRFFYERLGDAGYRMMMRGMARAKDPRKWLGRLYASSRWKDLCFPLADRCVGSRRRCGPEPPAATAVV